MLDYSLCPPNARDALRLYLENGYQPGSCYTSILSNDLKGAAISADAVTRATFFEIVSWLHWEIPGCAWGTPEAVERWIMNTDGVRTKTMLSLGAEIAS